MCWECGVPFLLAQHSPLSAVTQLPDTLGASARGKGVKGNLHRALRKYWSHCFESDCPILWGSLRRLEVTQRGHILPQFVKSPVGYESCAILKGTSRAASKRIVIAVTDSSSESSFSVNDQSSVESEVESDRQDLGVLCDDEKLKLTRCRQKPTYL